MRRSYLQIIGLSLFLIVALGAGCKKKPPVAPPPPPPPPPAAATATLAANPTSIERGQSSTLEWSTQNATEITIDPDLGTVPAAGSRSVRPSQSTTYRLTAKGPGGTANATARITVTQPPPPPPPPPAPAPVREPSVEELWTQRIKTIYFDYDKYDIRDDQKASLQGNGEFLRSNPQVRIVVEGHCDERGSAQYNLGLGQRRADSIKEFLVSMGLSADRLRTISYGKEKPACTDSNEACWQQNRRGVFVRE